MFADILPQVNDNLDTLLAQYEIDFMDLVQEALDGLVSKRDFITRLLELVTAALMQAYLAGGGNPAQMNEALAEDLKISRNAIRKFANELYRGRFTDTEEKEAADVNHRVGLWMFGALAAFGVGQMYIRDQNKRFKWRYSPEKDHCGDCLKLNGAVLTMREWNQFHLRPQSRNLKCRGYQCGCYWEETDEPSMGLDAVRARLG